MTVETELVTLEYQFISILFIRYVMCTYFTHMEHI